jgi:hypothetical protein
VLTYSYNTKKPKKKQALAKIFFEKKTTRMAPHLAMLGKTSLCAVFFCILIPKAKRAICGRHCF